MKDFQEKIQKLLRVRPYINKERFLSLCKPYCENWRREFEQMNTSYLHWISTTNPKIIDELINFDKNIQDEFLLKEIQVDKKERLKKVLLPGGYEIVDISTLEGLKRFVTLHETYENIKVLRHTDTIDSKGIKLDLFEGDVIRCYDNWKDNVKMILSVMDDRYIESMPYYVELLYTEKYGYLNPNDKPNKDEDRLKFDSSLFNIDGNYNYHVITLTHKFEVVCNIFHRDLSILKPIKTADKP